MLDLARFRYRLRKFLRFSELAARKCDVTPQQHQLLLGIAGFTGRGRATISELAEFLQERHNAVVGLVERAAQRGLVLRKQTPEDRRVVCVSMTAQGKRVLSRLTKLHREEIRRVQDGMLATVIEQPRLPEEKGEAPPWTLGFPGLPQDDPSPMHSE